MIFRVALVIALSVLLVASCTVIGSNLIAPPAGPSAALPTAPLPETPALTAPAAALTASPTASSASAPTAAATTAPTGTTPAGGQPAEAALYETALRPQAEQGLDLRGMTEYSLTVSLAPDLTTVTGQARIRYTNRAKEPLDSLYLHLFPNLWNDGMQVSDVKVDGRAVKPSAESQNSLLRVPLQPALAPGSVAELELAFTEPIPQNGDVGNYGEFAHENGVLAMAHFYPTVAVYDSHWHVETPALQGDVIFNSASLYDVSLTAPSDLVVVATGETLGSTRNRDGTTTWRLAGGPMRDFNVAASADYQQASGSVGDVAINSYFLPNDIAGGKQALSWMKLAMEVYQQAFGPYPYRELDLVSTSTTAGGIEYPGMIVVAERLYSDPNQSVTFEGATVHEVAHQWWYNVVGNDQVNDPWMDEAFAQYSAYLYYAKQYGEPGAQGYADAMKRRWQSGPHSDMPIGLPVADYQGAEYGQIVYGRGPLFFLALHDRIGEKAMTEFQRRYYTENRWRIATPAEFKKLAEEVSGQDLTDLFKEWVYPKGMPTPPAPPGP